MEGEKWVKLAMYLMQDPRGQLELIKFVWGATLIIGAMVGSMGLIQLLSGAGKKDLSKSAQ